MGKDKATPSLIPLKPNISYRLFVSLFKLKDKHRTSNVQLATGEQALVRLRRIEY
ncbi:MAG: hypothetical protein H8D67_13415 [Deltaproteobacteria bacterium]|nr:hypothetical protein [Deltaproteobacteria bacterium]